MAGRRGTILVVDDELDIREMIEVGLSMDGYEVLTAEGGQRALEVMSRQQIDLLITDLKMPGMSGVETASRLRSRAPRLPIIVVTGYLDPAALDEWRALGNVELIRKPFEFHTLADAVEAAIGDGEPDVPPAP